MKKSLNHLPQNKQNELEEIVFVIRKIDDDIEKIILFGSYARGDYKEKKDLDPSAKSGHISDYDILVVTEKEKTTNKFASWDDQLNLSTYARIIACDIKKLNIALSEGQYFFSDIKKEGIILYDKGTYELANKQELDPEKKQKIAKDYFDHWFKISQMFFEGFQNALVKSNEDAKYLSKAAFELHQAAEHSYKTILLVFSNYNPQEHYLKLLASFASEYHPELENLFPERTEEERERFQLLDYAYIGGRYDPNYSISTEDLEILAKYVEQLMDITEEICREKIKSFC